MSFATREIHSAARLRRRHYMRAFFAHPKLSHKARTVYLCIQFTCIYIHLLHVYACAYISVHFVRRPT